MHSGNTDGFGKWRSFFWPIHRWEMRKILPLFSMFGLITFNYNLLRGFKDAMVITARNSGTEALPFIKVWAILPCALLFTFIFARLASRYSRETVFYVMMSIFLGFFFLFTFFLFPLQEVLHPHFLADTLQETLPQGFKGLIAVFRNWTFTLFYVMAELWNPVIIAVLFWGFVNDVTTVSEARRYYGFMTIGGNIAGIIAGQAAGIFTTNFYASWIPYGKTTWDQSVLLLGCSVMASSILTMFIFRWMNKHVVANRLQPQQIKVKKEKMSLMKNLAYIARSKYLICIAVIVVGYNLAMNLIEVIWKNQIREAYPNPSDYTAYMGDILTIMGGIATVVAIFFTGSFMRRSWTIAAAIPVGVILVTGGAFFFFAVSERLGTHWDIAFLGATPLALSIIFGSLQQVLTRACKYTLFDATKEIAFIPLDSESKHKGKMAIDGLGSQVGKSGGAVFFQGILLLVTTVSASTPYIGVIFLAVVIVWLFAVLSLGKRFNALTKQEGKEPTSTAAQPNPNF